MLSNNPQIAPIQDYIKANGGSAKQAFYNKAKEMGVDPNMVLSRLK